MYLTLCFYDHIDGVFRDCRLVFCLLKSFATEEKEAGTRRIYLSVKQVFFRSDLEIKILQLLAPKLELGQLIT
jgi:hypothetical protein